MKADDSVPPFFIESEFRTLHLFRAPPSLITKQPNRPTLRVGRPKARRQNVRVLSRRSNLPKAVACGYSEGAGFAVLTEPCAWPLALLRLMGDDSSTRRRRAVSQAPRVSCALGCLRLGHQPATGTHQLGPSAEATPRRRRCVGESSRRPPDGAGTVGSQSTWALGAACQVGSGPSAEAEKSALRRRRAATTPRDGVGERSPAPATAAAALWFQSQGQRQWALLADNETAQALQHGCGDDCSRSASLAALHAPPLALH